MMSDQAQDDRRNSLGLWISRTRLPIGTLMLFSLLLFRQMGASADAPDGDLPSLIGLYVEADPSNSLADVQAWDAWAGVPNSIIATFMDLEHPDPSEAVADQLEQIWLAGYTPFVNLRPAPLEGESQSTAQSRINHHFRSAASGDEASCPFRSTAADIATGARDAEISAWGQALANWTIGGQRKVFIAPLHEMNWICYGGSPEEFRLAFLRMQSIFEQLGASGENISWVFHPNNQSAPGMPRFEEYYPGNAFVDIVSFSAYNWGACSPWGQLPEGGDAWKPPQDLFGPILARMRGLAPGKPIFVAETATSSWPDPTVSDLAAKDQWLGQAYSYLHGYPAVRGILYFNITTSIDWDPPLPACDFEIDPAEHPYDSYREALATFAQAPPSSIGSLAFDRPEGTFEDVWPDHPFAGVSSQHWSLAWIEALAGAGLTAGCRNVQYEFDLQAPLEDVTVLHSFYCPEAQVTRAEMAVFLKKGIHGSSYFPPSPDGSHPFDDIAGHWALAWIEDLYHEGMTSGYPDGTFRPENQVSRGEMAIFLLKAKHGPGFTPTAPEGGSFSDVPGHWAERWIERLKEEGITSGYPDGTYRPENPVSRAEMAVFLVRAFNLPLP